MIYRKVNLLGSPKLPLYAPVECDASLNRGQHSCRPRVEDGHKQIPMVSNPSQTPIQINARDPIVLSSRLPEEWQT